MSKRPIHVVGGFTLESTTMRVSDPLYDKSVWCSGIIEDCIPGQWTGAVSYIDNKFFGHRVSMLMAAAEEYADAAFEVFSKITVNEKTGRITVPRSLYLADIDVGVDSAHCGLFDDGSYQDNTSITGMPEPVEIWSESRWVNQCFDVAKNEDKAGVMPNGIISESGVGDGSYYAYAWKNNQGQVSGVVVVFL